MTSAKNNALLAQHRAQAWADIQSSSDDYDRNIMTLSSALLAASIAFLKDIVPTGEVRWVSAIAWSWGSFVAAILVTLVSYQIGIRSQKVHLRIAEVYYRTGDKRALKKNCLSSVTLFMGRFAGGSFTLGVLLLMIFAVKNLGGINMRSKTAGRQPIPLTEVAPNEPKDGRVQMNDSRQPMDITKIPKVVAPKAAVTKTSSERAPDKR